MPIFGLLGQVNSKNLLYNPVTSTEPHKTHSSNYQNAAFGKFIWHQFTTVVILRQNMRQKEQTKENKKFRIALENMRYGACTSEDIKLFKDRIANKEINSPSLDDLNFHNVSIIVSTNAKRDIYNEIYSNRFAEEQNTELLSFYSIDCYKSDTLNKCNSKSKN